MSTLKNQFSVRLALAAGIFLALGTTHAAAAVCVGSCGILGADGDVTAPPTGPTYGWVSTFGGVSGAGQLSGIVGTDQSTDGSTYTSAPFSANSQDVLQYYFNFVTSDGQDGAGNFIFEDYAWVQLLDATTGNPVAMLFNARTEPSGLIVPGTNLPPIDPGATLTPSSVPINANLTNWSPLGDYSGLCWGAGCGNTGWILDQFTIAASGNYMLEFGVSNWGDTIYDTGLAFSGLQIGGTPIEVEDTSVPEPVTVALFGAGLTVAVALRRREKNRPS